MRVIKERVEEFCGDGPLNEGARLLVRYDNMGEPYREGAAFVFEHGHQQISLFLQQDELRRLHECIGALLPTVRRS